jgi:hypothetical protein
MLKSPSSSSGTPAGFELCWIFPSFAQNSVANTLAPPLLPTASPAPRRRPRPSTMMLPSRFTSAVRSLTTQIWPAAATPRTEVLAEPVVISPIPPLNLTKLWADSAMADTNRTIPIIVVVFFTIKPLSRIRYQGCTSYSRALTHTAATVYTTYFPITAPSTRRTSPNAPSPTDSPDEAFYFVAARREPVSKTGRLGSSFPNTDANLLPLHI